MRTNFVEPPPPIFCAMQPNPSVKISQVVVYQYYGHLGAT